MEEAQTAKPKVYAIKWRKPMFASNDTLNKKSELISQI